MEFRQAFPIAIIDEDYEGTRELLDQIAAENFQIEVSELFRPRCVGRR